MNKTFLKLADQIRLNWVSEYPVLSEWEFQFIQSFKHQVCNKMPTDKQLAKFREIYTTRRKYDYYEKENHEEKEYDYTYDEVHDFDK